VFDGGIIHGATGSRQRRHPPGHWRRHVQDLGFRTTLGLHAPDPRLGLRDDEGHPKGEKAVNNVLGWVGFADGNTSGACTKTTAVSTVRTARRPYSLVTPTSPRPCPTYRPGAASQIEPATEFPRKSCQSHGSRWARQRARCGDVPHGPGTLWSHRRQHTGSRHGNPRSAVVLTAPRLVSDELCGRSSQDRPTTAKTAAKANALRLLTDTPDRSAKS